MIMGEYTFEEIKNAILEWVHEERVKDIIQNRKLEISKNSEKILLLDLTFKYCMAQLTVNIPFFAPYQYVFFEAMTLDSEKAQETGQPELVYFFYDTNKMTEEEVINELETGFRYCVNYKPGCIRKTYLNKRGTLAIEFDHLHCIVHPDDIEKVNSENVKDEFICKDTEAQYLVVENNKLLLRILPMNFSVKDFS